MQLKLVTGCTGLLHLADADLDDTVGLVARKLVGDHQEHVGALADAVPQRGVPHGGRNLQPVTPPTCLCRRRQLELVGELLLAGVVGADADHGERGAAGLTGGDDVEELAVVVAAEDGLRRESRVDLEALAVAERHHVPAVDGGEVGLERVGRAGEAAAWRRAEARLVVAGALVGAHLALRQELLAPELLVAAREADRGHEALHGAAARHGLRAAAAPAGPDLAPAPRARQVPRRALHEGSMDALSKLKTEYIVRDALSKLKTQTKCRALHVR